MLSTQWYRRSRPGEAQGGLALAILCLAIMVVPLVVGWWLIDTLDLGLTRSLESITSPARRKTPVESNHRAPVVAESAAPEPAAAEPAAPTANVISETPPPPPAAPPLPVRAQVSNTDRVGVVLHTAPRAGARTTRGLMEGAPVTIIERSGDDWALVRGSAGQEGWVPTQYLTVTE